MSIPHETVLVGFTDKEVIFDTHSLFDLKTNTITSNCTGIVEFELEMHENTPITYKLNNSDGPPMERITLGNNRGVIFSKQVRAGDRISLVFNENKIKHGKIQIVPFIYDTVVTSPTLSQVEYAGEVVKITEPGFYSVYTENGKLNIKRIDK